MAQTQVRGTVVDETGEPIIGVTVQLKGTSQGIVTDQNGQFSLSAPSDGILVFRYVGMIPKEVKVQSNLRVVLSDNL